LVVGYFEFLNRIYALNKGQARGKIESGRQFLNGGESCFLGSKRGIGRFMFPTLSTSLFVKLYPSFYYITNKPAMKGSELAHIKIPQNTPC